MASAVRLWKGLRTPAGRVAGHAWLKPKLKDLCRYFARIVLRMLDAGTGADDLDISSLDATLVAQTVLVRKRIHSD